MIHEINEVMDFEQNVSFISPTSVSTGNYIIKCFGPNKTPFYIQSPKCKSKQTFQKAGKKLFCDLVFTHDDEAFLRWIEHFESFCQQKIFENKSTWFDSELEMHDIENSFLPSLKSFKSGKQYILRANIPLRLGKCSLKIYNEHEEDVNAESIVENTNILSILEIQGIKCSSRSFQIEYEIKQMMVLNPVDLFEKCVFSTGKKKIEESITLEKKEEIVVEKEKLEQEEKEILGNSLQPEEEEEEISIATILEEVHKKDLDNNLEKDFCEIDLEIPLDDDILQLKNRNEVYFEMYREAKKKARMAREFALSAYLEAKRIKNTYLLNEAFDSDDEDELGEKSVEEMKI